MAFFTFMPYEVDPETAHARLGKAGHLLLDVRAPDEVAIQSIEGALNIPLSQLEQKIDQLKNYATIDVICRSGGRSSTAAGLLRGHGFKEAKSIKGGLNAWQTAGLPIKA